MQKLDKYGRKAYANARRSAISRGRHEYRMKYVSQEYRTGWRTVPAESIAGTAAACLAQARAAMAKDPRPPLYGGESIWKAAKGSGNRVFSAHGESKMLWIENPESIGLRFAGLAQDLARLDHTGWFIDNFQGETACGVVYLLPGRDGKARALAGYADPYQASKAGRGPCALSLEIFEQDEPTDSSWSSPDCLAYAARRADGIAERMAEEAREYDSAYTAGRMAGEATAEAAEARAAFLVLRAEAKAAASDGRPALCAAIARQLESLADTWRKGKETAARLRSGSDGESWWNASDAGLRDAFEEGFASV